MKRKILFQFYWQSSPEAHGNKVYAYVDGFMHIEILSPSLNKLVGTVNRKWRWSSDEGRVVMFAEDDDRMYVPMYTYPTFQEMLDGHYKAAISEEITRDTD